MSTIHCTPAVYPSFSSLVQISHFGRIKQPPAKLSGTSVWSMAATIASSAISSLPLIRPHSCCTSRFHPTSRTWDPPCVKWNIQSVRNVAQKSSSSSIIGRSQLETHVQAIKGVSSVCEPLSPDRPLWFPGSSPPPWLDGSLPGDFGFDPLGLGSDPDLLRWFAQAELMHSRWAMLAVAGILIPEWLEQLGFIENFSWYDAGAREYFADPTTLFVVQMGLMGWAEGRRWADFIKPGCVDIEPNYPNRKNPKPDVGYPGGIWFDPMMWGRGSPEPVMVLRTKEIKNGRLAMLAFMGFWFQAIYTGEGPLENLAAHLADPGHCNVFSAFSSH